MQPRSAQEIGVETVHQEAVRRRTVSLDEAIGLCAEHFGFDPIMTVVIEGEEFEVRFQTVWTAEQVKAFAALDGLVETFDSETKPRRNKITDEILVNPVTGEVDVETVQKLPHQIGGVEIDPPYGLRYLGAMFGGEDRARRAEAAGLTQGVVQMILHRMADQYNQMGRRRADPKS